MVLGKTSNPFTFLIALGSFGVALSKDYSNKVVNYISGLSLFIYLIHENLLVRSIVRPKMWMLLTDLIHINVVSGRFTDVGFRDLVKDIPDVDLADYNYPELDLERLDAEMKILAQAQQNIQTDVDVAWEGDFSDVAFGGDVGFSSSSDSAANVGQTIINPESAEAPAVVGSASTEYGNAVEGESEQEESIKELVVYCPECGETFIFKYEENPKKEGDENE